MRLKGNYRKAERIVKGFSNHKRVEILELLNETPELSVFEISDKLGMNFKTLSEHLRKMTISGLVLKRSDGVSIRHCLSERGKKVLKFLKDLE
jgi:DNA-binding transcriptional ArsR family regulator